MTNKYGKDEAKSEATCSTKCLDRVRWILSAIPLLTTCVCIFLISPWNREKFSIPDYMVAFPLGCASTLLYESATFNIRKKLKGYTTKFYLSTWIGILASICLWLIIVFFPEILGFKTDVEFPFIQIKIWTIVFALGTILSKESYDWIYSNTVIDR